MPYTIKYSESDLVLELKGGITARDVADLAKTIAGSLQSSSSATVRGPEVDDIDTSVLQMLVSLRQTASTFVIENPSEAFEDAIDRCALRRELLADVKETA